MYSRAIDYMHMLDYLKTITPLSVLVASWREKQVYSDFCEAEYEEETCKANDDRRRRYRVGVGRI